VIRRLLLILAFAGCASTSQPNVKAFDSEKLREIDAVVRAAVTAKRIPGGVIWIEHDDSIYHRQYGYRAIEPELEPMTKDTIFDAASITKVIATAPSIWLLMQQGKIALDVPVKTYLDEFTDGRVTIRHLMTHTSGLPPSLGLHEPWSGYDEGIRRALAEKPRNTPGMIFRYSDINYILLGEIVRRVSGKPLEEFARGNIFEPLEMRDTGFWPNGSPRIAPTERVFDDPLSPEPLVLRGVVHDPTARRMGGVAGHAGVFTTAGDLAKFARAVLHGNFFPRAMTEVATPANVAVKRAAGFDVDSQYSRPRGEHFPIGTSFGHTGWTGGFLWIDPGSRTFYIFLSNRVHPDGTGSVVALQKQLGTLVAESIRGGTWPKQHPRVGVVTNGGNAQNGIDVLESNGYETLNGMRIGLITNQSGIDHAGNPTIDVLRSAPGVSLVALFSPEHGIRGDADAKVADETDSISGLPVYSLYGERRKPSPEQLANLDALVFDIQDIGTRFYTYIATMGMAMEAAAEAKIKFVVLDRVNPIGGELVEGPLRLVEGPLSTDEASFTAWHSLPVRHAMTVGELAQMFRDERSIDVDLTVVPIREWERAQWQDDAGLPWINPSPNMRSLAAAALYPGIGLLERAISVGRGTDTPFEIIGAPYIDGARLAKQLVALPGVRFTPVRFTPTSSIFAGQECGGVRLTITDRKTLRAVDVGITLASTLATLYPQQFKLEEMQPLLRHQPTIDALKSGQTPVWDLREFMKRRAKYLMY
jgi:uncharacterized protein YbbC (DUF1343 family)/CubicO group peptidase (beta-lactamase class C family)